MVDSAKFQMSLAIRRWMTQLETYPGWKEWQRDKISHTLHFDDALVTSDQDRPSEFLFSDDIEKQHLIVYGYLKLQDKINTLKDCEYYFRRYPFRGLPVSRFNHITNICEMYFNRFYEFRERLKDYLNELNMLLPEKPIKVGALVKAYDKIFDPELRERNGVHHRSRFEDLAIDRITLTELISTDGDDRFGLVKTNRLSYRKATLEWAQRVRRRSQMMEEFFEAIAEITFLNCKFLSDLHE